MDVLYYSNYCKHCKELLTIVTKSSIKSNLYFICIDKRENKDGVIHITQENGKKVKLPEIIQTVPSMILFSRGNLLLEGKDIYKYIKNFEKQTSNLDEPNAFSLNFESFTSDSYSYLSTSAEDMNCQGDGGMEQLHNYVAINEFDTITTPPENYISNRVTSSDESVLNKFMEERDKDITNHKNPLTGRDT
jgi:hypothetical protein